MDPNTQEPTSFDFPVEDVPSNDMSFDFSSGSNPPVPSGEALELLTDKYTIAGGDSSKREEIARRLATGEETNIRAELIDRSSQEQAAKIIMAAAAGKTKLDAIPEVNPATEVSKLQGKYLVDDLLTKLRNAGDDTAEQNQELKSVLNSLVARKAYVKDYISDLDKRVEDQSWLSFGADLVGSALAPWAMNGVRFRNALTKEGDALLPGGDLKEQVDYFMSGDFDLKAAKLTNFVEDLFKKNPTQARDFLRKMDEYTDGDEFMTNVMSGVNIATYPFAGALGRKLYGAASTAMARGSSSPVIQSILGNTPAANGTVMTKAMANPEFNTLVELQTRAGVVGVDFAPLVDRLPATFDAAATARGSIHFTAESAARIFENMDTGINQIMRGVDAAIGNARINDPSVRGLMLQTAQDAVDSRYPNITNRVLAVEWKGANQTLGTEAAIVHVGTGDMVPFTSAAKADYAAASLGIPKGSYKVLDRGNGEFTIGIVKELEETSVPVMDRLATVLQDSTPSAGVLDVLRSPDFVGNKEIQRLGLKSTMAAANLTEHYRSFLEPVKALSKDSKRDLGRLMEWQTTNRDPISGQIGVRADTLDDFHNQFNRVNSRVPTEAEAKAYFHAKAVHDIEYMTTNMRLRTSMVRAGIEQHSIPFSFEMPSNGLAVRTKLDVQGKRTDTPPWNEPTDDFWNVAIWSNSMSQANPPATMNRFTAVSARNALHQPGDKYILLTPQAREDYGNLIRMAYGNAPSSLPTHILVKGGVNSRPLPLNILPDRGGFHKSAPTDGLMISQPRLTQYEGHVAYNGDRNIFQIEPALARDRASVDRLNQELNTIREMARDAQTMQDWAAIDTFVRASALPIPNGNMVRRMFSGRNPMYDPNTPVFVRQMNQNTVDANPGIRNLDPNRMFISEHNSYFNLFKDDLDLSYTGERGAAIPAIDRNPNAHVAGNPQYSFARQSIMDPGLAMDQSLSRVMRGTAFDDYRNASTQSWIARYGSLLDDSIQGSRQHPIDSVFNPNYAKGSKEFSSELYREAERERRIILEMMGMKSRFNEWTDTIAKTTAQQLSRIPKAGPFGEHIVTDVLKWRSIDDPARLWRSAAFHPMMGLFNPTTFFTNLNTLTHMLALSPRNAVQSSAAAFYTSILKFNDAPTIINSADKAMRTFGWKQGEFNVAYDAGKNSGWFNTNRTTAALGDFSEQSTVNTGRVSDALHTGTFLFRKSDEVIRKASWFTAWREVMGESTTIARPSERQITAIMDRANTLSVNMTSASNATWQRGFLGVPSQFFSYATRLSEQMLSSQAKGGLTPAEKMRVVLTYSAMYGVPVGGVGAALGAFGPMGEGIKKRLIENNMYQDDSTVHKVLMNGMPEAMIEWATGERYAFGEKFGPTGNAAIRDLIWPKDNDKHPFIGILGGPGGKEIAALGSATLNLLSKSVNPMIDETDGVTTADVIDVINTVSTSRNVTRSLMMLHLGAWVDKNGHKLKDASKLDAVVSALTGLQDREIVDIRLMQGNNKARTEFVEEMGKQYTRALNDVFQATNSVDAKKASNRARLYLNGLTPDEVSLIFRRATKGKEEQLMQSLKKQEIRRDTNGR